MPTFILGRDDVSDLPGVENDDIEQVTITYAGDELDATVFKSTPLDGIITQVGLVDVSIECTCTHHEATRGLKGTFVVGNSDGEDLGLHAQVMEIKKGVTPKGKEGYTISYALSDPDPA